MSSAGFRLLRTKIKAHCKKARLAHGSFFFAGTADGSVSVVVSSESFKRRSYFKLWKLAVSRDIEFHMTEAGVTAALASRLLVRPSIEQPYFDHSPSLASFLVTTFHLSILQVPSSLTSRVVPRTRDSGLHYHALYGIYTPRWCAGALESEFCLTCRESSIGSLQGRMKRLSCKIHYWLQCVAE